MSPNRPWLPWAAGIAGVTAALFLTYFLGGGGPDSPLDPPVMTPAPLLEDSPEPTEGLRPPVEPPKPSDPNRPVDPGPVASTTLTLGPKFADAPQTTAVLESLRIDAELAANSRDLTLTLTNEGTAPATDITIVDMLGSAAFAVDGETNSESDVPPEILLDATPGLACEAEAAAVSCGPATLAPGAEAVLTVQFNVKAADPLRVNHFMTFSARVPPAQ